MQQLSKNKSGRLRRRKKTIHKGPILFNNGELRGSTRWYVWHESGVWGGPMIVLMSHLTLGNWWFQILQNQILLMSTGLQSFSRAVFATWNGCGGCFPHCGPWCVLTIPCGEPQQGKQPPHRCLCKVNWSGREGTGPSSHHAMIKGWIQPCSSWKC